MADRTTHRSFCRICIGVCGIEVEVEEGRAVAVRGDVEHPISAGYTCTKGRALPELHAHAQRLDGPLVRTGQGNLVACNWPDALGDAGARLRDIVRASGPEAIGFFLGGGMYFDAAGYWAARRLQRRLGAKHVYSDMTIDSAAKYRVGELMAGSYALAPHADPAARLVLLFGTNPVVSHGQTPMFQNPVERIRASTQRGQVWVVDPRTTESARLATRHLPVRAGTDHALLAFLVRDALHHSADRPEMSQRVIRVEELAAAVAPFTLERTATITGLPQPELLELRDAVRRVGRLAILTGTGVTMSSGGNAVEWLAWALLILTDSMDQPGGMWFNPGYVARLDERDSLPSAGPPESGPPSRPEIPRLMGEWPAAVIPDEIEAGNLRALVVLGGNLATALPDTTRVIAALGQLELLVVLEVARTATTQLASHVLPCHAQLERPDVSMLSDLFNPVVSTQYTPAVLPQHPGRRSSWWILDRLGASLGLQVLPDGLDGDEATDDDVLALVARGELVEGLRDGQRPWAVRPSPVWGWVGERLPRGQWDLAPEPLVKQLSTLRDPPPLVLTPRRQPKRMNGRTVREGDKPLVMLHPVDAAAAGVGDGDLVDVTSATGRLRLQARVTDAMRPGAASIPHGWEECNVNRLISAGDLDELTGMPRQSGTPVCVRGVPAEASAE